MYVSELGEQWHAARVQPAFAHLDSAAAGRSSDAVIEAISAHLWRESARGSYIAAEEVADEIARDKRDLASLIGHTTDELAFR